MTSFWKGKFCGQVAKINDMLYILTGTEGSAARDRLSPIENTVTVIVKWLDLPKYQQIDCCWVKRRLEIIAFKNLGIQEA